MLCILPANNARVFAKAIHTIAKFGDIYFDPEDDGLSLKSINNTKSAFITYKFYENFFSTYRYENNADEEVFDGRCKVAIKTLLGVFKNMKQVEQCKISVDSNTEKIIVEFNCKLDTRKVYTISIMDIEVLHPGNIDNIDNRNKISGATKIFSDISNNFQMAEEEITIVAEPSRLIVKNYIEGQVIDPKFMRSQLKLKGEEFDVYSVKNDACITFCLREFRALLHFAESVNIDYSMFFEDAGMPVVFKIANLSVFEATLFMSTLSPDDITMVDNLAGNKSNTREITLNNIEKEENEDEGQSKCSKVGTTEPAEFDEDDLDVTDAVLSQVNLDEITKNCNKNSTKNSSQNGVIRRRKTSVNHSDFPIPVELNTNDDSVTFNDNDGSNMDCVPGSPPSKKARMLFRRCFEPTYLPSDSDTVLALDSDTES